MKVYLSISRQAKLDHQKILIDKLIDNPVVTNIRYYAGGEYSDKDLLEADFVIVLTHNTPTEERIGVTSLHVGRGVFTEVTKAHKENIPCFIVREIESKGIEYAVWLTEVLTADLYNPDDWVKNYGVLSFKKHEFKNVEGTYTITKSVQRERERLTRQNNSAPVSPEQPTRTVYSARKRNYLLISRFI